MALNMESIGDLNKMDIPDFQDIQNLLNLDIEPTLKNQEILYYDIEDISKEKIEPETSYKYHALHVNIQSLSSKFEKLQSLLAQLDEQGISLDFLLICETFLNDTIADHFQIPGYNFIYKNRKEKCRGGVAIYVKKEHNYTIRHDLSTFVEGEFEALFLEIKSKNHQP